MLLICTRTLIRLPRQLQLDKSAWPVSGEGDEVRVEEREELRRCGVAWPDERDFSPPPFVDSCSKLSLEQRLPPTRLVPRKKLPERVRTISVNPIMICYCCSAAIFSWPQLLTFSCSTLFQCKCAHDSLKNVLTVGIVRSISLFSILLKLLDSNLNTNYSFKERLPYQ